MSFDGPGLAGLITEVGIVEANESRTLNFWKWEADFGDLNVV